MLNLSRPETDVLAYIYVYWESGRGTRSINSLRSFPGTAAHDPDVADHAIAALLGHGLIAHAAEGEGTRRHVEMTSAGIEWFQKNVAYLRDCNQYWFKARDEGAHDLDAPPSSPSSLRSRLRDPLVPGAAVAGAGLATLLIWWI